MRETKSTCPYCGVGCGVVIESSGAQITGVRGDPTHPANFGRLCTKGSTLHLTANAAVTLQTRLLHPQQRAQRGGTLQRVGWDAALGQAAQVFARTIQNHGPDAVGFYVSGQLLTEDYYVFNKLAKGVIGTNNIDTNSRLCMSSAVAGYKATLGADAPPACYQDVDHADCLFITGSNTAWAHPILFRRIEAAKATNPAMKIVVCDPRRTDTAAIADLHLPLQPGTDVMLFHGMLHTMLWEGWTDAAWIAAHTSGFDALKALVRDCTPDVVARTCGISKQDLLTAAQWFAGMQARNTVQRANTLSLYCQGLNQSTSGTDKNAALINLHLATAQVGRAGAGPFSLTGQPNAMGGREVGGMANLLSGHRDLGNPQHRAEVAALWGVPNVPATPGKTAVEMFEAAADGQIKALWIACTNPAQSMPDQAMVHRALQRCEFVVVQEAFSTTATCAYADLLLPATTWGEKTGTVTNSERRISRVRPAVSPPGETRHDWAIAVDFAQRLEGLLQPSAPVLPTLLPFSSDEAIWNEHRETTRGRDLDITGLSYALLDQHGPQQWPCTAHDVATALAAAALQPATSAVELGRARLYADGVFATTDGRARFAAAAYRPVAEARDARYPFALNTGRLRDQWHGMSRTGTLGRLFGHVAEPCVQLNPHDLERRGLQAGDLVQVTSRRGGIFLPAQASADVALTHAFIAMHWGGEYLGGTGPIGGSASTQTNDIANAADGVAAAGVNALTNSAYCPTSKQPELKHSAVRIARADLPWTLLAMAWLPAHGALTAREALRPLMAQFPFASCVPFANNVPLDAAAQQRTGVLFRAAALQAPADGVFTQMETLLGLCTPDVLRYADTRQGQRRVARLVRGDGTVQLVGFLLGGDTRAEAWLTTLLQEERPAEAYGRLLLVPGAQPPVPVVARGQQVCSCFNITDVAIRSTLAGCSGDAAQRLGSLQAALRCGTNCGSCIPELKRLVQQTAAV